MQAMHLGLPVSMGQWGYRGCDGTASDGVPVKNRTTIVQTARDEESGNLTTTNSTASPWWGDSSTALWQGDVEPITGQLYRAQSHFTLYAKSPEHAGVGIHPGLRSFYWPFYTLHTHHVYPNVTEISIFKARVEQVKMQLAVTVSFCTIAVVLLWAWARLLNRRQASFKGTHHSISPEEIYEERVFLHTQEAYEEKITKIEAVEKNFKKKSKQVKKYKKQHRKMREADEKRLHEEAMQQMETIGNCVLGEDSLIQDVIAQAADKRDKQQRAEKERFESKAMQSAFRDPLRPNEPVVLPSGPGAMRLAPIENGMAIVD